ncbi:hypothetical protein DFH09DRAFT_1329225 [Mycena vulgaris]|nr:hypothetical protein DFH09DRAFT_1329225 [Mycena vulgaris]
MPTKRKSLEDIEGLMEEAGLTPKVLELLTGHPQATTAVVELVNRLGIKESTLKRARLELPSFSDITWKQAAQYFRLSPYYNALAFRRIYLVPVVALFSGHIADAPECSMPETESSSGGSAEHQLFIVGNVLFLVVKLKLGLRENHDINYAQLFSKPFSTLELNRSVGFPSLKVYGLLTDTRTFDFFSFDPVSRTFYRDSTITFFGWQFTTRTVQSSGRISLEAWEQARDSAVSAQEKLMQFDSDLEQLQQSTSEGLELLARSMGVVRRATKLTSKHDLPTKPELEDMAHQCVLKWHRKGGSGDP